MTDLTADQAKQQLSDMVTKALADMTELYDQLMALCQDGDSFYYVDHEKSGNQWYRVFSYRLASYSDFLKPGAMEARGIMFEVTNFSGIEGYERPTAIKSRPPAKFFNIGENPLTLELDYTRVKHSVIKEDGSLASTFIEAYWGMGEDFESQLMYKLRLKSKTSTSSEQAKAALAWVETQQDLYDALLEIELSGYTVNCEWCAPDNRIVVGYLEPQLIVLNARNRASGKYMDREVLRKFVGDHLVGTATQVTCEDDLKPLKDHTGYEGLILQFDEDYKVQFVKFKNDWYLHRHRTKDSVNNANALFDCVLNEGSDDLRTLFLGDELALKIIDEMEQLVIPLYNRLVKGCETFYEENKHLDKKEFAIKAQIPFIDEPHLSKMAFGLVMSRYIGREADYKGMMSKHKKQWTKQEDDTI